MTAVVNNTVIWRALTSAENYNWIKKLSDLFTAVGFVKHTDTGQIDLTGTTVALPGTVSATYQECGYEIRKLVASGKPTLYCRVGYGVYQGGSIGGAAANYTPVMRMRWSTSTDGAGQLDGVATPPFMTCPGYYSSSESTPSIQRPFYASSDGANYLTMVFDPSIVASTSPANALIVCVAGIERTLDADTGLYDGDGFVIVHSNNGGVTSGVAPNLDRSIQNYSVTDLNTLITTSSTTLTPSQGTILFNQSGVAGVTPLFPITVLIPKIKAPMRCALAYYFNDVTDGTSFATTVYGSAQTMIASGRWTTATITPNVTNLRLALRYD